MTRTPNKGLNEGARGFVKGTGEFLRQMSTFRLTPLDTEWINAILNNTRREDIPNAYKKILNELSNREIEIEKDRKQQRVVNDALVVKKRYMGKYKQWKNGELPGKALISELKPVIEHMENAAKIFEGEQIDKSRFQFPFMVETGQELVGNTINYLRAFYDELEQENTAKNTSDSLPPQAPETEKTSTITLEQVLKYEEQALALLLRMHKIKYIPERKKTIKDKELMLHAEYRINTSINDVRTTLLGLMEKGEIHIIDVDLFMKDHLKSKKGKGISNSISKAKVKKREIS